MNTMRKASTQKISRFTAAQQVTANQVQFILPKKQWKEFCDALDAPPRTITALRRLLNKPVLFDARR